MPNNSYTNLLWAKFSQDALMQLEKNPKIKPLVDPFIEPPASTRAQKPEITVQEVSRPALPPKQSPLLAFFSSSIGLFTLLLLYAANVYAAYEIAVVRTHPVGLAVGLSAVLPILGPIIFICIPTRAGTPQPVPSHAGVKTETFAMPGAAGEIHIAEASWQKEPAAQEQQQQIFQRGQFTFNRRFFETKFSNFFTSIRRDADKDLVFIVKTQREDLIVQRITRIATNEVRFEVGQGPTRRETSVPFSDIQEIQLKPKDA